MRYNVHYYMSVRVVVPGIETDSQEKAMARGLDHAWTRAHDLANSRYFEFAEECTGALVDEQGDEEYLNSQFYDQKDVYNAESRYEQDTDQRPTGLGRIQEEDRDEL